MLYILAIVTLVILAAALCWIEAEQAEYDRKHYDPKTEKVDKK